MFGPVDTDEHQFVFHRKCGNFVAIDLYADLSREKLCKWQTTGKITQREIVVQFDEEFRIRLGKKILAGNFPGVDSAEGDSRHKARTPHPFRTATTLLLPNHH